MGLHMSARRMVTKEMKGRYRRAVAAVVARVARALDLESTFRVGVFAFGP
jgi:hypothetical protein